MQIRFKQVDWEFATAFRISYRTRTHAQTVQVELREGDCVGRGEGASVSYHGETVEKLLDQLQSVVSDFTGGVSKEELQLLLPPGGARNALDCALWDLEAKRAGCRAWDIAGIRTARPLLTAYTLGVDSPAKMGAVAAAVGQYSLLKIKLMGDADDLERVSLIRRARPGADLILDANQSWSEQQLRELLPQFERLGVKLIEQPLAVGKDQVLSKIESPVPLCADESFHTAASVAEAVGKYQYVNIKLDKAGGITEALRTVRLARIHGLKLMVGCMAGSSLAMAPAFVVGQLCDVVDLDGPLLSKQDMPDPIRYDGDKMFAPDVRLWG